MRNEMKSASGGRKIFLFMMISLDGYFEGENHDLSWHHVDREFNEFAAKQMQETGAILFGRRTYELMQSYWPTAKAEDEYDHIVAKQMNTLPKYVFSHTLQNVEETKNWQNVHVVKENVAQTVKQLKQEKGGDIAVLGSNNLCVTLLEENLLDELRIMVNPIVIGKGTTLFQGIKQKYNFTLSQEKTFTSGNVLLTYKM